MHNIIFVGESGVAKDEDQLKGKKKEDSPNNFACLFVFILCVCFFLHFAKVKFRHADECQNGFSVIICSSNTMVFIRLYHFYERY